jgi:exodeoxyribonuclease VII small subunit
MTTRDRNAKPEAAAPPDFESAMTELERIVEELEGNQLTLDQSLAHYERGMVLANQLTRTLDQAEKRIEKLVEPEAGEPRTEPLESAANRSAEGELPF